MRTGNGRRFVATLVHGKRLGQIGGRVQLLAQLLALHDHAGGGQQFDLGHQVLLQLPLDLKVVLWDN